MADGLAIVPMGGGEADNGGPGMTCPGRAGDAGEALGVAEAGAFGGGGVRLKPGVEGRGLGVALRVGRVVFA